MKSWAINKLFSLQAKRIIVIKTKKIIPRITLICRKLWNYKWQVFDLFLWSKNCNSSMFEICVWDIVSSIVESNLAGNWSHWREGLKIFAASNSEFICQTQLATTSFHSVYFRNVRICEVSFITTLFWWFTMNYSLTTKAAQKLYLVN